jgi:hypothetical protein
MHNIIIYNYAANIHQYCFKLRQYSLSQMTALHNLQLCNDKSSYVLTLVKNYYSRLNYYKPRIFVMQHQI